VRRWVSSAQGEYQVRKVSIKCARWVSSAQGGYQVRKVSIKCARWVSSAQGEYQVRKVCVLVVCAVHTELYLSAN
jgi:hypothetical protein